MLEPDTRRLNTSAFPLYREDFPCNHCRDLALEAFKTDVI
jgi:hypothetical protein